MDVVFLLRIVFFGGRGKISFLKVLRVSFSNFCVFFFISCVKVFMDESWSLLLNVKEFFEIIVFMIVF